MHPPLLLLWDIDGTLLQRASRAHVLALHRALRAVHGVDVSGVDGVTAAGRTDGAIARDLLRAVGVPDADIDAGFAAVAAACADDYDPGDLTAHVAPGIAELLPALAADDGYRLSLVTGNYQPIARIKLGAAGIGHHFEPEQGGFGSDAEDRAELPPVARSRAGRDGPWPRERTVVIGDTPNDIACARADGVGIIAVTTGPFGADDLTDADHVVSGAHELAPLLTHLAG